VTQTIPLHPAPGAAETTLALTSPPPPVTMADVLARIEADPALSPRSRRDMVKALHTFSRAVGVGLAMLPAQPPVLRERMASASAKRVGIKERHWDNVRSLTLRALGHAGVRVLPGRARAGLSPQWEPLSALLTSPEQRYDLSRFMRFCSAEAIQPEQVDAGTFAAFHDALQAMSVHGKPWEIYRTACLAWSGAVAKAPGWPQRPVPIPSASRRFALEGDAFSPVFLADRESFLTHSGDQDPFADDYAPSVKPSTVALRRNQIMQIATALVRSGFPVEEITSLAVLVQPENARRALRYLRERSDGKLTVSLHQRAQLLKTIARHWVKRPVQEVEVLRKFASNIAPKRTGMVEKNKTMMRQFDDPDSERRLLELPGKVFGELANKQRLMRADGLRAMYALAVDLLLVAPLRINMLVGLELGRHLVITPGERTRLTHLLIATGEDKTPQPFEAMLRDGVNDRLHLFLERYRPRVTTGLSPYLFANAQGQRRSTVAFSNGFSAFIRKETGLILTRHIFRHLAVRFLLEEAPGDMETPRLALSHTSSITTGRSYADRRQRAALDRLGHAIERRREQHFGPKPIPQKRAKRGARS
jgi:integrase